MSGYRNWSIMGAFVLLSFAASLVDIAMNDGANLSNLGVMAGATGGTLVGMMYGRAKNKEADK